MHNYFCRILFRAQAFLFIYFAAITCFSSVSPLQAEMPLAIYLPTKYDPRLTDWLVNYLNTLTDDSPIEDALDAILEYHTHLTLQGYHLPPISGIMPYCRENLMDRGIEIPDDMYEYLQSALIERSSRCDSLQDSYRDYCGHDKKKKQSAKKKKDDGWHFSFTKKSIFGLIKMVGGSLTCLVPIPVAQYVGSGLIVDGALDVINECRDGVKSDEKAEENKRLQRAIEADAHP